WEDHHTTKAATTSRDTEKNGRRHMAKKSAYSGLMLAQKRGRRPPMSRTNRMTPPSAYSNSSVHSRLS
ncbi:unnamed protein product, partial [Urochloa humidicola]